MPNDIVLKLRPTKWLMHNRIRAMQKEIAQGFDTMFTNMFIVDAHNEWPDRFSSKSFTDRHRSWLVQNIPKLVDAEFGDDLLAQSMPVLEAALRAVYIIQENDHPLYPKPPTVTGADRAQVVSVLNSVVMDYIVCKDHGVPVVRKIIEERLQALRG